jgi:anaerobic ribonucleoside-triphosphate reductase activating protein
VVYYSYSTVSFQEVPDEVSLSIMVSGCPHKCRGCHSSRTWRPNYGQPLTKDVLVRLLEENKGYITCVNFLGGEWDKKGLTELLTCAKEHKLRTCLYTGEDDISSVDKGIVGLLDYIKIGKFVRELGGVTNTNTNQRMYKLSDKGSTDITIRFINN